MSFTFSSSLGFVWQSCVVLGGKSEGDAIPSSSPMKTSKRPKSKEFVLSDSEEEEMEHRRSSALERRSEVAGKQSGDAGLIKLYNF